MARRTWITLLAAGALLSATAAACSEKDESAAVPRSPTPAEAVATAAERSWSDPATAIQLEARSPADAWAGAGVVDLRAGRLRVDAEREGARRAERRATVVGLNGEGTESTVLESPLGARERCWLNPHAPVGFYAQPVSVEEAMRLTGSIVESLRHELAMARAAGGGFEVRLRRSATRPGDDFSNRPWRVWGDRNLVRDLTGPIRVSVDDRSVAGLSYSLHHRPSYRDLPRDRRSRTVDVTARLTTSVKGPAIDRPSCAAIE